jgi:ABC-type antimicrobial peptide transport system permease subunit
VLGGGGLGIVVMRNVMERRGEMATLRAIGFSVGDLRRLIFVEHALLLTVGMVIGLVASVVAIWPAMSQRSEIPLVFIGVMLGGLLVTGLGWAAAATLAAVRGRLTEALRGE